MRSSSAPSRKIPTNEKRAPKRANASKRKERLEMRTAIEVTPRSLTHTPLSHHEASTMAVTGHVPVCLSRRPQRYEPDVLDQVKVVLGIPDEYEFRSFRQQCYVPGDKVIVVNPHKNMRCELYTEL